MMVACLLKLVAVWLALHSKDKQRLLRRRLSNSWVVPKACMSTTPLPNIPELTVPGLDRCTAPLSIFPKYIGDVSFQNLPNMDSLERQQHLVGTQHKLIRHDRQERTRGSSRIRGAYSRSHLRSPNIRAVGGAADGSAPLHISRACAAKGNRGLARKKCWLGQEQIWGSHCTRPFGAGIERS